MGRQSLGWVNGDCIPRTRVVRRDQDVPGRKHRPTRKELAKAREICGKPIRTLDL